MYRTKTGLSSKGVVKLKSNSCQIAAPIYPYNLPTDCHKASYQKQEIKNGRHVAILIPLSSSPPCSSFQILAPNKNKTQTPPTKPTFSTNSRPSPSH